MLYDKDIREPLFDFLEAYYGKVRILEEKQMGRSRADIVMVLPSALVGIEIKSDADTYVRLTRQVKDYDQYFDYNYVAAGVSHAMHQSAQIPAAEQAVCDREDPSWGPRGEPAQADQPGAV